jgi:hypothetical protein
VSKTVDSQRCELLPYSDEKLLLRDSAVSPQQVSADWWIVYQNEERGFEIHYNEPDSTYHVSLSGRADIVVPSIRQVVDELRK